ncbi:tyrosine-type recombinase/integrase [Rhodobacter sp. SY28-1]|uniref:tyrosine-type recombinase/integrase n=1 Tax=Rhodobacter sp. SY28-1 TaxID=2562317 RepID=UPI0014851CA6|nr:tyrosine-type recombinase/integrase [Rhodobacter sp. SY28-1]
MPKEVSANITKREFKRKLGESEREALAAYPRYHAEVEREIAEARLGRVRSEAASKAGASEREAYAEALRRRADLVAAGASDRDLALTADSMAEAYPQDEYEPQGVPPVERHMINLLRHGPEGHRAPEPTLGDAKAFYLKERGSDEPPEAIRRFEVDTDRIIGRVKEALGRDPVLTSLTRDDARNVRDYMLDRLTVTGKPISPASVARDLNGLNAVINFTAREMPLPATFQNPFSGLSVGKTRGRSVESENRDPLPEKVLKAARERIVGHAKRDLALIWRLLEGTGCRLSEVSGLRVEDVDVTRDLPHIRVTWHENRRLKTDASSRYVPLVGDALKAAKEALKLPREGNLLFADYGHVRGGDAASAALMKHVRAVTTDPKHVVHSLRHNIKDRLMLAEVASLDQNLILGHALGGVGERVYGGDAAKLRVTTRAMRRAFGLSEVAD